MTLRHAIRDIVIANVPQVQGRVYQTHAVDQGTPAPFIVIQEVAYERSDQWADFILYFDIWMYIDREGNYSDIDEMQEAVLHGLDRVSFTYKGETYVSEYDEAPLHDVEDDQWIKLARYVRIRVFSLGWLENKTYDPDPVDALRRWSFDKFPDIQSNPKTWDINDERPGIYWRVEDFLNFDMTNWGIWCEYAIRGHILAPTVAARLYWLRTVVEELALSVQRNTLIMADGTPMYVSRISADSDNDPFKQGQLRLIVRFGRAGKEPPAHILHTAGITGFVPPE